MATASPESKAPDPKDKVVNNDHARDTSAQIASLPAADQRAVVKTEMERVAATSGSTLPDLAISNSKDTHLAVISKDGKPTEIVDDAGKTWKADGKNLFSDGQNQRLLAPKMVDGQPVKNDDGSTQYDLLQVKTSQEANPDGSKRQVVTQITDGDGRKWASADGQNFIGAAGANGGQAGDQRVLKDNNGSLEFTDPKGGQLSETAIKAKEQQLQNLIQQNTSLAMPAYSGDFAPVPMPMTGSSEQVDGRNLNKVLENSSPDLLARYEKDLNLRASLKDKMSSTDYEDMTRILDGATSNVKAHADRIFANGTGNSGADAKPAEQEVKKLLLETNAADMPKLNDALLNRINADPNQKNQYDQYVAQHQNDPGFDVKNAAIAAFSQNFSKETQDSIPLLTKGNDQLDTAAGGTTPRQQLVKQALDSKDFDSFKTAITGAPAEARAAISKDAVDGAFSNLEWTSKANQRNLDIAHDLLDKGQIQPDTNVKYSNMDQADKVLSNLTPEQRASYNAGKDNQDPNNADRQFYNKMQDAFKGAAGDDAAKMLRLDDEARKKDGSYIASMTSHEGFLFNDSTYQVTNKLDTMTPDQRKDMADNYDERRKQLSDMVTALHDDPKQVLDKFDQMFKKTAPDADTSAGALLGNLRVAQNDWSNGADGMYEGVAKTLQKGFTDDPDLFNRLKNPQTESEKQLAAAIKDPEKLFGDANSSFASLSTEGRLSMSEALRIGGHGFEQTTKDILGASAADKQRFLTDPVEAKKELGALAMESNVDQKYELMKNILQQGKMNPEDEARAVAIGWNKPEDLKAMGGFDSQTGANYQQKYGEDLQNSFLNKFGHQDNSVNDFLSKYNNVFQKADNQVHEAAVAGSGLASTYFNQTGSMTPQEMDVAANQMADMSAKFQKQLDTAPDAVKPEMQAFIDAQKRLKDATDKHEDATKQLADAADKAVAVVATAAVIAATGGAALGVVAPAALEAIVATAAVGSAASRIALKESLLGPNWKDKEKDAEMLDVAVDAAAQIGAIKLLKIASVMKGLKAGEGLTVAAKSELEPYLSKEGIGSIDNALGRQTVKALPAEVPAAPTAPETVVKELPPPAAPEAPVTQAALPKPTGTEIQPTTPAPNANPQEAGKALVPSNQDAASKALEVVKPTGAPAPAPLQVQAPSSADIASGKITPDQFAKLSPETKEFMFQMAQLGGIGAVDAKLKGENAAVGAAEWMAMGAAIHGAFAGLERSGVKLAMSEAPLKGDVLGPGEMPAAPQVHDSMTLTTGNGTKIVSENGKITIDGKPGEYNLSKVGDDYKVEYRKDSDPKDVWTRADQANKDGIQFKKVQTDIGDLHGDVKGENLDAVNLKTGEKFEKDSTGKWQEYKKTDDGWIATSNKAGDIDNVVPFKGEDGQSQIAVTYKNSESMRVYKDGEWSERAKGQGETAAAAEPVEPAPAVKTEAPVKTAPPAETVASTEPTPPPAEVKPVKPLDGEIIEPVRPPAVAKAPDPIPAPKAPQIIEGEVLKPAAAKDVTNVDTAEPAKSIQAKPTIDVNDQALVPVPKPEVTPERVAPVTDVAPAVKEPVPTVVAEPVPEAKLPANPEKLPSVREQGEPVTARPVEEEPVQADKKPVLTPQQEAILASQAATQIPKPAVNDNMPPVEAPPVAPLDIPSPNPQNAPVEPLQPSATLAALATIKNWEGPFHSSDRVLQAVLGRRPTFEEIRSLTRAMQDQFKMDHNGADIKAVGLKHGDQFLTAQNAESTIGLLAKSNPELAAQMRAYMQVDHDLGAKLGRAPAIDEVRAVSSQVQQNFLTQNHLQSLAQADAQQFQNFAAANDDNATLQAAESNDQRLQRIAQFYQQNGKLPPDGIISQKAFPDSAGHLHHHKRHAARR